MKKIGYVLMITGILLFIISGADVISIFVSIIEKILSTNLNAPFYGSFIFRAIFIAIGGFLLCTGGLILKKYDQNI